LLADRAFVAWLAGDNAAFERYIEDILHSSGTAAAANRTNLADVWFDGDGAAVAAKLLPRSRAFMLLLLAGRAESAEERSALLEQALAAAHLARDIWVEVLIVTARAMSEPDLRATWLGEALRLAGDIGEPAVAESIRSLMENGSGQPTLAALARRFGGDSTLVKNPAIVRVNALSRTVWRGNSQIVLSNRALSLVLTLAVLKGVRKETLAELLWGVDAVDSGSPALKMLVMRARAQLGDPSLIVANNGGYELRSDVIVDFEEIERLLRSLSPHEPLTELQREALRTAYDRFKASWLLRDPRGPTRSIEAAIAGTRQRVIERLARDALDRGEIGFAFDLADQLRRYDGNDEVAYELLIRAYIRSGNNASALREYRKYSDHLMHDLGLQPSFSLEDLFEHPPSIGR
jgi:DNA-binding SARP family transcriptional activator